MLARKTFHRLVSPVRVLSNLSPERAVFKPPRFCSNQSQPSLTARRRHKDVELRLGVLFDRLLDKPLRTLTRAVWTPCTSEIPCPRCQRGSAVGLGVSVNVGPSVRTGDGMGADSWRNSKKIVAQVGGRFDTARPTDSFSDSRMQPTGDGQPCRPTI